jgi:membrane-bound lytic murein transglycosylase D
LKLCAVAAALAAAGAHLLPHSAIAAVKPALPSAFEMPDEVPLPDPDLWQRIRVGFSMEPLDSPLVQEHEAWYASRPDYIKRFVDRGSRYLHYIVEQVEKRGMPTEIALLPVVESAFTPRAQSRAKASGIWQFIPSTGKNYGLTQDWWHDNRNDVVAATDAALNYLQKLYDQFGSWELALAAYNCGEGCVGRAIAANQRRGLATDYLSLNLPPETRNYVPKLIAVKNIVLAPNTYGVELDSVPDKP